MKGKCRRECPPKIGSVTPVTFLRRGYQPAERLMVAAFGDELVVAAGNVLRAMIIAPTNLTTVFKCHLIVDAVALIHYGSHDVVNIVTDDEGVMSHIFAGIGSQVEPFTLFPTGVVNVVLDEVQERSIYGIRDKGIGPNVIYFVVIEYNVVYSE